MVKQSSVVINISFYIEILLPFHNKQTYQVAWGDLSANACGGTHVRTTGDIGEIVITRVKEKKGELSVQYELKD